MKMVLIKRSLVLLIAVLFIALSIVPVSSLRIDQESLKTDERTKEITSFNSTSTNSENDVDINERWSEREDFERDVYERYPWRYDEYLRNDSGYLYEEPYSLYPGYDNYSNTFQHGLFNDEYIRNHAPKNRKPTPKPNFVEGNTIYVDDDSECPGDGSHEWPYCKIQYAIDNANDGDTVIVLKGFYDEFIFVNKSVIVKGINIDTTIIHGGFLLSSANNIIDKFNIKGFIFINSCYNSISNILFDSYHSDIFGTGLYIIEYYKYWTTQIINNAYIDGKPIYYYKNEKNGGIVPSNAGQVLLANCSNFTIKNINTTDTKKYSGNGIFIGFSTNNTIEDNKCTINIFNSTHNKLVNNTLLNCFSGISLAYSSNNIISNNTIQNSNSTQDINLWHSSNNTIFNNSLMGNYSYSGIRIGRSNNNLIKGNSIYRYKNGFRLYNCSYNNIENNYIAINENGIDILDSNTNTILYNNISNNTDGISIDFDAEGNNFSYNDIKSNQIGINCVDCKKNYISNNVIEDNSIGIGIYYNIMDLEIFDNSIFDNNESGIHIYGGDNENVLCIISKNNVSNNADGIFIFGGLNVVIEKNEITENGGDGITGFFESDNIFINGNNISSNFGNGISLSISRSIICNNTIESNGLNGIELQGASIDLHGNKASSNQKNGMELYISDSVISDCIIKNHKNGDGVYLSEFRGSSVVKDSLFIGNHRCGLRLSTTQSEIEIQNSLFYGNGWGIDLKDAWDSNIKYCTFVENYYAGIYGGNENNISKNNFIKNYNHYIPNLLVARGYDTNIFFRNYWSGRLVQSPLPYRIFNNNWDMLPRAIPYILPLLKLLIDKPSDQLLDSDFESIIQGDLNEQNNHFTLIERLSDRLSYLFSKEYDVLSQDHRPLLDQWRHGR